MEAEDDAAGTVIEEDEIYANGRDDIESQRHRPIISGEQLDVEAYAALYTGRTKITRLLFISDKCGVPSMELEALRMAYDEIKKGENTQLFREVVGKINGRLGPNYGLDNVWADSVDRRAESRKEKLENELNAYRVECFFQDTDLFFFFNCLLLFSSEYQLNSIILCEFHYVVGRSFLS